MGKRNAKVDQESNGISVVQLATRVPKTLYKRLKLLSVKQEISIAELVAEGIENVLDKREAQLKKAS